RTVSDVGEVSSDQIWHIFQDEYLPADSSDARWGRFEIISTETRSSGSDVTLEVTLRDGEEQRTVTGTGNGPIAAFLEVLREAGREVTLYDYVEHAMSASGDAQAAAYVDLQIDDQRLWGVGVDGDISMASLKAIVSAVNRTIRAREDNLVTA
ncbi:MAG: alpha-isopropylmalate synthase regulatory domain-containing protein, partial [Microbacterium sp.]